MGKGKLIVITGPSGVGKSTLVKEVVRRTGARFSVSMTTRSPRPGEMDGVDYRFVDRSEFSQMIDDGGLLEWAEVFGRMYGTPAAPVQKAVAAGEKMILDIDVQGGLQVHRKMPDATFVLILPPSMEELARRLGGRGSEDPQAVQRRLGAAQREIETAKASGVYNYEVINDDLTAAVRRVVDIVNQE